MPKRCFVILLRSFREIVLVLWSSAPPTIPAGKRHGSSAALGFVLFFGALLANSIANVGTAQAQYVPPVDEGHCVRNCPEDNDIDEPQESNDENRDRPSSARTRAINAYNEGNAYLGLQNYRLAIDEYLRSLAWDSSFVIPYRNLGTSYLRLEMYDDAIDAYDNGCRLGGDQPSCVTRDRLVAVREQRNAQERYARYQNDAWRLFETESYEAALGMLNAWIESHPDDGWSHGLLGLVYEKLNENQQALESYDRGCSAGHPIACRNQVALLDRIADERRAAAEEERAAADRAAADRAAEDRAAEERAAAERAAQEQIDKNTATEERAAKQIRLAIAGVSIQRHQLVNLFTLALENLLADEYGFNPSARDMEDAADKLMRIASPYGKGFGLNPTPIEEAQITRFMLSKLFFRVFWERAQSAPPSKMDEIAEELIREVSPSWFIDETRPFAGMEATDEFDWREFSELLAGEDEAAIAGRFWTIDDPELREMLGSDWDGTVCRRDEKGCQVMRVPRGERPSSSRACGGDTAGCLIVRLPPKKKSGRETYRALRYPTSLTLSPDKFIEACGGSYLKCMSDWPEPEKPVDFMLDALHFANVLTADGAIDEEEKWDVSRGYLLARIRKDPSKWAPAEALAYLESLRLGQHPSPSELIVDNIIR